MAHPTAPPAGDPEEARERAADDAAEALAIGGDAFGEEAEDAQLEAPTPSRRDKKTRFEIDERRPAGLTALTDTMSSDVTSVPVLEDNQTEAKLASLRADDTRYQLLERKLERLERRLEAYEGLQYKQVKSKAAYRDGDNNASVDTQQLIEFFLTEMDKQSAVIAQMRANQRVLEQKLEESLQKTHRFHREQLHRMSKFQEVVQLMNTEFVRGSVLRDEEKALEKNQHEKKTKAVWRALDEQIGDLKNETTHHRRRLEIKFEKKYSDLMSENQLVKAENLELRDEVAKLAMAARSTKRTVRILSDEVIKLKRAVGSPPNHEVEELLRLSGVQTSQAEVHHHPPKSSPPYRDSKHQAGT